MRRSLALLTALLIIAVAAPPAHCAETSVKGTVYSNWSMNLTDSMNNYNAFTISRAYFGAESKLSEYTFVRVTFDIRPERFSTSATKVIDSNGDTVSVPALSAYSGYPIILKYAYADWKIKPVAQILKVRFGLQPTMYLNYAENVWNRRYLEKTIGDLNGWLSTSDLAVSALFALGPKGNLGEAGVSVLNGAKYSDVVDKNNDKDVNLYARLTPFHDSSSFDSVTFFAQAYLGTQNKSFGSSDRASDWRNKIYSVGGRLAYQKMLDLCFDLNFRTLGQGAEADNLKQRALSFWGDVYLNALVPTSPALKTLALFGRVDLYDPNTNVAEDGNTLVMAGLECAPVKGVKGSLGLSTKSYQAPDATREKYLFVNTEFKF